MAAFGILAALHERERSGEGQLVDVSMTDGALSWLAMVAGALLRRRRGAAARRRSSSPAASSATCPTRPPTAGSRCGALEPKFWQALLRRRRAPGPDREAVRARPARTATREVADGLPRRARATSGARSPTSTTAASSRCSTSTRRSTPSWCARARWWSSSTSPSSAGAPARRPDQARRARPATPTRPAPGARRAHRARCCARPATPTRRSRRCEESGAVGGPGARSGEEPFLA